MASYGQSSSRLAGNQARPDDTNCTGAEIKSNCLPASLSAVLFVQAAQNVVPVAVTSGDKIEQLRQWASGRVLSADLPEITRGKRARRELTGPAGDAEAGAELN